MHPDEPPTVILPGTHAARHRSRWPAGRAAVAAALAVVLLAGIGVLAWPLFFRQAAASTGGEVFLESTGTPGRDPFTGDIVVGNPPGTKSQTPVGAGGTTVPTVAGDRPALYGGSRNEHVCDRQKLITFLQQNQDKAAAWASVLGIQAADIATYIGALTPLQLRADTRVTNHGFANGRATTLQSVLQAGTAVLVDDMGRPRVKCGCGNPLLDPIATPIAPSYTGNPWPDFSPRSVSAVSPATTRVVRFVVYDIRTGETFYRPSGSGGEADTPTTPTPVVTTTPTPPPSPTALLCPQGTQVRGSGCVSNAPVACPSGQIRVSGRCVPPPPVRCPDGSHASEGGTTCVPNPPSCPDGTHIGGDGKTCVDDPPTQCPDGTHLSKGTCIDDPPTQCPEGTHLSEGTCIDDPPAPCPPGTHPISDGTSCAKDAPPTCDDGYHVGYTGVCIKDCPDGYETSARGGCIPPHDPTCPEGYGPNPDGNGCHATVGRRPGTRRRRRIPTTDSHTDDR